MKRYLITMEFYVLAGSDEKAIYKANKVAKSNRQVFDNKAIISSVERSDFGSLNKRKISLDTK